MKPARSLHELEEERAVPWTEPAKFAWHVARYEFALPFVADKRVLDVGCGEGYGAALLAGRAREVVGVDYSPAAIEHAARKYKASNLTFAVRDATELDATLGQFDVVSCFEVIEHVEAHDAVVDGFREVLSTAGLLFVSTPNKLVDELYEAVSEHDHYEYHVNMLTPRALRALLSRRFRRVTLYGQSAPGNALHTTLKTLDVLNLRHRLFPRPHLQRGIATRFMGIDPVAGRAACRFSRLLVRQSPIVIAVAQKKFPVN
jgi:2-polyprenyl-3-methyl-5-hydroxy-6-metoxy-1,4-benzoquinol methylase